MDKRRVAVLISGRGSNMTALADAARHSDYPAEIVLVISNNPKAAGLTHATDFGIETAIVDHRGYDGREDFEKALDARLTAADIEIICLAGFMRILAPWFVDRWRDRILNIHPSLLPAFKGLHTHERALETGVRLHGCTVHIVRADMDAGPIVIQAAIPVLPDDTPDTLAERMLRQEHRIYPHALALLAGRRMRVVGEQVLLEVDEKPPDALIWPPAAR